MSCNHALPSIILYVESPSMTKNFCSKFTPPAYVGKEISPKVFFVSPLNPTSVVNFFPMSASISPICCKVSNINIFMVLPLSTRILFIKKSPNGSELTRLSFCGSFTCLKSVSSNCMTCEILSEMSARETRISLSLVIHFS